MFDATSAPGMTLLLEQAVMVDCGSAASHGSAPCPTSKVPVDMLIRTEKTETKVTPPISPDALELCGLRETGLVFKGLTRSMSGKLLQK